VYYHTMSMFFFKFKKYVSCVTKGFVLNKLIFNKLNCFRKSNYDKKVEKFEIDSGERYHVATYFIQDKNKAKNIFEKKIKRENFVDQANLLKIVLFVVKVLSLFL